MGEQDRFCNLQSINHKLRMSGIGSWKALTRKKTFSSNSVQETDLSRCMSLFDLTLLGIGATLGLGVYVLAGSVAKNMAGPATTISFLVAGVASAIAALCYAEFASRVPRAGSAYIYSYVCVGEAAAFVIGWSLVMEYVIGSASVARGLVSYIDAQTGQTMAIWMKEKLPMNVEYLSPYPDFVSCLLLIVLSCLLASGVKESTLVNNLFTIVNVATILTVVGAGAFKADPYNWNIPKSAIPVGVNGGEGGFIPFGVGGIMKGAAECFYGFVGFDAVATTGEEAKNPQRNIPLAIVISLTIIFFAYFSISTVLTMMWPYYDQNPLAPLPHVFTMVGWPVITWIVTIGAVFALMTSMIGSLFPLPRILYAMANDGLLYKFLANIHPKTRTPVTATLVSGVCSGIIAMIFDLQHLVEMLSIGTLLAYSIVAVCVLILRYEDPEPEMEEKETKRRELKTLEKSSLDVCSILFNLNMKKYPSQASTLLSKCTVGIYCLLAVMFCTILTFSMDSLEQLNWWAISLLSVIGTVMLMTLVVLSRQPNTTVGLKFKVPLVPILPAASILMNTYLMLQLESATWVRLGGWMLIGFFIYFTYGIRNSVEGKKRQMLHDSDIGETSPPLSSNTSVYIHHHPAEKYSPTSEDTKL